MSKCKVLFSKDEVVRIKPEFCNNETELSNFFLVVVGNDKVKGVEDFETPDYIYPWVEIGSLRKEDLKLPIGVVERVQNYMLEKVEVRYEV